MSSIPATIAIMQRYRLLIKEERKRAKSNGNGNATIVTLLSTPVII